MANAIELVTKMMPVLDEQYRMESRSAILDTAPEFVRAATEANKIKIARITTQGLANYNKQTGFLAGDETLEWDEYTFPWDRGRSFQVDAMDNLESMGLAFGRLAGDFNRNHVIPEIDAARFATYAAAGTTTDVEITADNILGQLDDAQAQMDDNEVPENGRICFLSTSMSSLLMNSPKLSRMIDVVTESRTIGGRTIQTKVAYYNDMRLVKVPKKRFYDKITLEASGEGGYKPQDSVAKYIDFMIIHPSAVFQHRKHEVSRVWAPNRALAAGTDGVNPNGDAWKFDYRLYHGAFAYEQKKKEGIILNAHTVVSG